MHSQAHTHHVAALRKRGSKDDFKDVKKGSILPDLSTLWTWGGRRQTHEDSSDCTCREQVGRWAEGRGLVLQSLGSWLGSGQTGRNAGISLLGHPWADICPARERVNVRVAP